MIIARIKDATRHFGAPKDWNPDRDGFCGVLPIRDVETSDGMRFMVSAWEPTPEELAALNAGATIKLWVSGSRHPVVSLSVGDLENPA